MARKMVTIPSENAAVRDVQRCIREDVEKAGFDCDRAFAVQIAVEEALINAIKHGNKFDPAKRVHVEWSVGGEGIEITIEDEGAGFERTRVPDPTHQCNLEKLNGRGILLMESYMDSVEWDRGGRRVRMVKKAGG